MDVVVDANVLFAALIRDGLSMDLLLDRNLHLYVPEFIFEEFSAHVDEILQKTKRTRAEFDDVRSNLEQILSIVPNEDFEKYLEEAVEISPDKEDAPYVALALKLKTPIWSNDKKLKEQSKILIYNTTELFYFLRS